MELDVAIDSFRGKKEMFLFAFGIAVSFASATKHHWQYAKRYLTL